jgi:hypothetical protein
MNTDDSLSASDDITSNISLSASDYDNSPASDDNSSSADYDDDDDDDESISCNAPSYSELERAVDDCWDDPKVKNLWRHKDSLQGLQAIINYLRHVHNYDW